MENWLMGFRLSYLRAIALSWKEDPAKPKEFPFKKRLLEAEDLLTSDDPEIAELFGSLPKVQATISLRENLKNPTEWEPMEAAGWIGENDTFEIMLPALPSKNVQDQALALASYYNLFPTLLGNLVSNAPQRQSLEAETSTTKSVTAVLAQDLGVDPGPFLEFGGVTLRAIAVAWKSKQIMKELLHAGDDATPVLSRYLGYNNPWNFNIRFKHDDRFTWNSEQMCWDNVPKNKIELYYPQRPDDERYHAIALTSYNNTGPAYPFTCG